MRQSSPLLLKQTHRLRRAIRSAQYNGPTSGLVTGAMQGKVVILPADWADEFLLYCQKNPTSCPLIGISEVGDFRLPKLGSDIDLRYDIPEYYIYQHGKKVNSCTDIATHWQDNFVTFVLGCSFSFENALSQAGLTPRNVEEQVDVPMYETNIATVPVGRFFGNTIVTMRPYSPKDAIHAIQITSRFPKAHGAPLHFGSPSDIGIDNLALPDFGNTVSIKEGEVPIFWASGITPQIAVQNASPPIYITNAPGKMLVTDLLDMDLTII
ncbi:hypothetical protein MSP8887_03949 [Marinomonas spartinae]|uniref:putative hydro-lyase n=1 Tax=Marinomonas spartinae TaxID=1792290 RepID=UPI000809064A|nr:putative hydro-lyase [Marinomonas spartinae]SBS39690.1 hypothetical protein MSP8887_03949 [Marinomonas spartinae]